MDLGIAGRTGLVTGASVGIGRAIALALAKEGVRLAITGRRSALLEEVSREIADEGGPSCTIIAADAFDAQYAKHVANACSATLGGVDILINNAGANIAFELHTPESTWSDAFRLNFDSHRQLTDELIDSMMANGWGRIINITGKVEQQAINGAACAKAAMHVWASGLAKMVGKHGVTVNCIPPGRIMSEQVLRLYSAESRKTQSERDIPVGEFGEPEDIADLVCFLASKRARYITGAVIPVDGGLRRYPF